MPTSQTEAGQLGVRPCAWSGSQNSRGQRQKSLGTPGDPQKCGLRKQRQRAWFWSWAWRWTCGQVAWQRPAGWEGRCPGLRRCRQVRRDSVRACFWTCSRCPGFCMEHGPRLLASSRTLVLKLQEQNMGNSVNRSESC